MQVCRSLIDVHIITDRHVLNNKSKHINVLAASLTRPQQTITLEKRK